MTIEELIEHLGSDAATREDTTRAVTDDGRCLICGGQWWPDGKGRRCPHDEIQVIAFLRAKLGEDQREACITCGAPAESICGHCRDPICGSAECLAAHDRSGPVIDAIREAAGAELTATQLQLDAAIGRLLEARAVLDTIAHGCESLDDARVLAGAALERVATG